MKKILSMVALSLVVSGLGVAQAAGAVTAAGMSVVVAGTGPNHGGNVYWPDKNAH